MQQLPVQLLAVDIDGTLLNSTFEIADDDLHALRSAHACGVEVVVATGRRHHFALAVTEQLGFDHWILSSNGAITRSSSGETFYRDLFPTNICRELCSTMNDFRGRMVLTFDRPSSGAIVLEQMDQLESSIRRWLQKNLEFIDFVVPLEDSLICDPVQAMFCGPIHEMQRALEQLENSGLAAKTTVLRTEYPGRDLSMVDVLNAGCSKGHALERWASHRGYERKQVMAIGDNYNDVEMLEWAGVPVIMGNAAADLRQRGWMVTRSNDECGLAAAVQQVVLGRDAGLIVGVDAAVEAMR